MVSPLGSTIQSANSYLGYLANNLSYPDTQPNWLKVWKDGFEPQMSLVQLIGLRDAIVNDSPELLQETTTNPPPLLSCMDQKCCGGCAIAYCGMMEGKQTVGEVEEFFAKACYDCDMALGEPAACRFFLNAWDDNPMSWIKENFLPVLMETIEQRKVA